MNNFPVKNKSLKKALDILNCFAEKQPLSITEISQKLGLNKSNTYDILSTFCAMDYLTKDPDTSLYSVGVALCRFDSPKNKTNILKKAAHPHIQELANLVGEAVFLSVPSGESILYIDGVYPYLSEFSNQVSYIGNRNKMYCTASGKVMMAFMSPKEREIPLGCAFVPLTEYTITDRDKLIEECEKIRQCGYAFDRMEFHLNRSCIAVPLLHPNGQLIGAISISGPTKHIENDNSSFLIEELLKCARNVTNEYEP